jgi:hypothetical protein
MVLCMWTQVSCFHSYHRGPRTGACPEEDGVIGLEDAPIIGIAQLLLPEVPERAEVEPPRRHVGHEEQWRVRGRELVQVAGGAARLAPVAQGTQHRRESGGFGGVRRGG